MDFPRANTIQQVNGGPFLVQYVGTATLGANALGTHTANPASLPFKIRSDDFVWVKAFAYATCTFRHRLYSDWESRYLDNDFVRSELFWGTSIGTALEIPLKWMPLNGSIRFDLEDTSGAGGTVELYMVGMKGGSCGNPSSDECDASCDGNCYRARYGKGRGLYVLSTPSLTGVVAQSNSPGDGGVIAEDKSHLRTVYLHAISRKNAANTSWRGYTEHLDPREDERTTFANAMVRGNAWTGTAANPNRLPSPLVICKGSECTIQIQDLAADGTPHNVDFSFIGERLNDKLLAANG